MTDRERTEAERQFEQRLARYAAIDVRTVDAAAIASGAIRPRRGRAALVLLAAALLGVFLLGALLLGGGSTPKLVVVNASPLPPSTPGPTPLVTPSAARPAVAETWLAVTPQGLSFAGEDGLHRWRLAFATDGTSLDVRTTAIPRLRSRVDASTPGVLELTTTDAGGDVEDGQSVIAGCAVGDVGRYAWSRSADGLQLDLTPLTDACASRSIALGRSWTRSLVADNVGGRGVVDAFTPSFEVTLPPGTYSANRTPDAVEIWAADESIGLLAWKDPQGFKDPCDITAGRYPIQPGAAAFADYFRQNRGFDVLSETPMEVGGHPATHVVIRAKTTVDCPTGWLLQWQPKIETSQFHWHVDPGVSDSLYVVDMPDATLVFEILQSDPQTEARVIGSIEFPESAPPSSP